MWALSHHLAKRLTRLSGLVPSGTFVAMWGSWVLLLPTIPLMSAARVIKCLATVPDGWPGHHCVKASRMARYLRRLSLIACSFWMGCALQREYTMSQPLKCFFQNDLQKCPVENLAENVVARVFIGRQADVRAQIRDHSNIARAYVALGKAGIDEVNGLMLTVAKALGFADPSIL